MKLLKTVRFDYRLCQKRLKSFTKKLLSDFTRQKLVKANNSAKLTRKNIPEINLKYLYIKLKLIYFIFNLFFYINKMSRNLQPNKY